MPQRSNRTELIEGTLRCLDRLPVEQVTSRAIAAESGANLASIAYHFGSKDALVTTAVVEGLDRWLDDVAARMAESDVGEEASALRRAAAATDVREREGLAVNFYAAVVRSRHDPHVQRVLREGFRDARPRVAAMLGLRADDDGIAAAGALIAMFDGLVAQALVDPGLTLTGDVLMRALARVAELVQSERV